MLLLLPPLLGLVLEQLQWRAGMKLIGATGMPEEAKKDVLTAIRIAAATPRQLGLALALFGLLALAISLLVRWRTGAVAAGASAPAWRLAVSVALFFVCGYLGTAQLLVLVFAAVVQLEGFEVQGLPASVLGAALLLAAAVAAGTGASLLRRAGAGSPATAPPP